MEARAVFTKARGRSPANYSREHCVAFAQALRAVGKPVFGRKAREVSMGRLLAQLFEITGLFDMRLRPELVLLQKTMVTVEGVARRIDPEHDIWLAAEPIVSRWIARELGPTARIKALGDEVVTILRNLADLLEHPPASSPPAPAAPPERPLLWFALGVAVAALAFAVAALLSLF